MSTEFVFANFAEGQLTADMGVASTVLTISAADAAKFSSPTGSQRQACVLFDGVNDPEVVYVETNVGTGSFTVARAQEGTSAREWLKGTRFFAVATAGALSGALQYWIPAGVVMWYANDVAPTGWLECDGSAISRATYASLFSAIGTTFGVGDGSTTFNLPDLRGEFIRGWDNGAEIDSGRIFGSNQSSDVEAHSHDIAVGDSATPDAVMILAESATAGTAEATEDSTGTETRPRNVALMACIKY